MTVTSLDNPDWESQMREMLGDDAEDMIRRYQHIIDNWVPLDEPVAIMEIATSHDDVLKWLPAAHLYMDEQEGFDEIAFRDFVWNAAFELTRVYMQTDSIDPDDACTDAMRYFWSTMDDDDDTDESEEDEDSEDDE
jgi:hypothetical protein